VKYLLTILFVTALLSCNSTTKKQEGKGNYFEGFVEFKISYEIENEQAAAKLKKDFGIKTVAYIGKNGLFCREFIDSSNIIVARQIYRPDSLKFYTYRDRNDTMFCSAAASNPNGEFLGIVKQDTFKILGRQVDIAKTRQRFVTNNGGVVQAYFTYYNDVNLPINPLSYKNVTYENIENVFSGSPYVTTGYIFKFLTGATVTFTATRIVAANVPAWHFVIPQHKIIIYQNQ